MLTFKGIQKTTLIDYPGKIACTLFLPKCDLRCPFCYNKQLALNKDTGTKITEKQALKFLSQRKGFLEAACITGGEPLLHQGLLSFLKKAQKQGLKTKLDTNGTNPQHLNRILQKRAADYIAMDIKSSKQGYPKAAGKKVNLQAIEKSIALIQAKAPDYEFRTTVVPKLHTEKEITQIGKWLKGSKRLFLQQFNPNAPLLSKKMQSTKPYSRQKMQEFAKKLETTIQEVRLRGI